MPMQRWLAAGLVPGLAVMLAAAAAVRSQPAPNVAPPAEPRVVAESRFRVTEAPNQAELIALVVDFPRGAWTSLHTHGGQAINLVLEGEITLRQGAVDRPHQAGQSWSDSTGQVHAAGNTGAGPARLLTNFLLPRGAPQITVIQETPFGPAVTYEARFPLPKLPADADIVSQVLDLPPGRRAERPNAGFTATVLMEGEVGYGVGATLKTYRAGESWSAPAGVVVREGNADKARVFTTHLLAAPAKP